MQLDYARPQSIDEAVALLGDTGARALAGGTDLLVQIRTGRHRPERIVDIKGIQELRQGARVAGLKEERPAPLLQSLGKGSRAGQDHGQAEGHGLVEHQAPRLVSTRSAEQRWPAL